MNHKKEKIIPDDIIAGIHNCVRNGNLVQGLELCRAAISKDYDNAEVIHLLGFIHGELGDTQNALDNMRQSVSLKPRNPQYRYNYAVALHECGLTIKAMLQYQACLRYQPNHLNALWNYGEILRLRRNFKAASLLFERFIKNGGAYPAINQRMAVCYAALGDYDKADFYFKKDLDDGGANPSVSWEWALYQLSRENFSEGFKHYHHRFDPSVKNNVYCHDFSLPRWDGEFYEGANLLIHGEQGLGDEMMFASIIPEVLLKADKHNMDVYLAVKPALVKLFSYNFPNAVVLEHAGGGGLDAASLPGITWQAPIGDLATLFRSSPSDFEPGRRPYLKADPERSSWYAQHLQALEPSIQPDLRVGLMWGSNPLRLDEAYIRWSQSRSIPAALFNALSYLRPRVRFVSLQNADRGDEAALMHELDVFDLSELQTDFAETAALVENLDLVVSVCTSVSHLAGGMGHPCLVALMKNSDWRHGQTRDESYWYSNTRYFRQDKEGDWTSVITKIGDHIERML